jgi:hypothetical protein
LHVARVGSFAAIRDYSRHGTMAPLKKYGGIGPWISLHFYYYLMYINIPIMQCGHYDVEYGRYRQISVLYLYSYLYLCMWSCSGTGFHHRGPPLPTQHIKQ